MSALRNTLDRLKPTFSKGGKLSALGSFFDAMETFFFVPKTVTRRGTHIKDSVDLKRTMITVMVALIPVFLFSIYNIGYQMNLAYGYGWGFLLFTFFALLVMVINYFGMMRKKH